MSTCELAVSVWVESLCIGVCRHLWPSTRWDSGSAMLQTHKQAYKELKAILATDCIDAYPDYNLLFKVYTNASNYQMGVVIMQQGQPFVVVPKGLVIVKRGAQSQLVMSELSRPVLIRPIVPARLNHSRSMAIQDP